MEKEKHEKKLQLEKGAKKKEELEIHERYPDFPLYISIIALIASIIVPLLR